VLAFVKNRDFYFRRFWVVEFPNNIGNHRKIVGPGRPALCLKWIFLLKSQSALVGQVEIIGRHEDYVFAKRL
jgi:hypothetical protein